MADYNFKNLLFKTAIAACVCVGTMACQGAQGDPNNTNSPKPPKLSEPVTAKEEQLSLKAGLEGLVDRYGHEKGFSGTVLVAKGGEILVERSYGLADMAWDVPNQPDTKYRVGSLTKPFLATLVMKLAEDGILSLDGQLGDYLPDLYGGSEAAAITVAQLLSHTSGLKDIPGHFDDPWYHTTARQSYKPHDFAAEWIKPELLEAPGTKWRYNNAGFILLGLIIEAATDAPYEAALERYIFNPAGMEDSGVFSEDVILPKLAHGYAPSKVGDVLGPPLRVDASIFSSAAGIYSTARDIHRFDQALYAADFLSADSRRLMTTKATKFPYGYGWGVERWTLPDERKLDVLSHTGSIPGFQSYYLRSEEARGTVIILNNTNNGRIVRRMGRDLMEVLNGKPIRLDLADALWPIIETDGEAAMIAAYKGLGERRYAYDLSARAMNSLGYRLLRAGHKEAAIAIFEAGTKENSNSANIHDSLGETYRAMGRIDEAIAAYQKAVDLQPDMPSSIKALKEMREAGR